MVINRNVRSLDVPYHKIFHQETEHKKHTQVKQRERKRAKEERRNLSNPKACMYLPSETIPTGDSRAFDTWM